MIDILDKHIDAQIQAYKSNRYEDSNSKGMSHIRRLFKGNYNENHQSIFGTTQKRLQGHRALEVQQTSDSIRKRN